jgi:hypothetical protein
VIDPLKGVSILLAVKHRLMIKSSPLAGDWPTAVSITQGG